MSTNKKHEENMAGEVVSRGEKFVEKNLNKILLVVLIIVVVVFAVWAYLTSIKKPKDVKASANLYQAEDRFINNEDSTLVTGEGELNLLEVAKQNQGTKASNLSHAYAGICFYDMGKYDEAIEELKKFSADEEMVAPSITRLIGDAYVQLGQFDNAVKYFEQAASDANNPVVSPSCLVKAGHVYEELKQYDKALKAYQTIKDKYYTSNEAKTVDADIVRVQNLKK